MNALIRAKLVCPRVAVPDIPDGDAETPPCCAPTCALWGTESEGYPLLRSEPLSMGPPTHAHGVETDWP